MAIKKAHNKAITNVESGEENAIARNKKLFLVPSKTEGKSKAVYADNVKEALEQAK